MSLAEVPKKVALLKLRFGEWFQKAFDKRRRGVDERVGGMRDGGYWMLDTGYWMPYGFSVFDLQDVGEQRVALFKDCTSAHGYATLCGPLWA